ncbi:protein DETOXIFICATION 56-like [Diospyros lotus]|uniref:protein DETOXIFICATION 56-like n=1 Tax=Diospyros lotus TaxID=55363 RepID=UPI00224D8E4E|nr:protein DETOXIFICATION 56-like [Diospyros lotus]
MPSPPPEENPPGKAPPPTSSFTGAALSELKAQRRVAAPLVAMNLTWFAKTAITTAFLGRLGELPLAGGAMGLTFANVTGFSVLNGLCSAMEPICGQAHGARNLKLLHRTLLMTVLLLLLTTLPICLLWLNVDKILLLSGQRQEISFVAKKFVFFLLPDLVLTSFLCPLKAYLSSQSITVPNMLSSALAVALHVPINILLSKARGIEGISMAIWITDLMVVIALALYVVITENRKGGRWNDAGWWEQDYGDWIRLLKLGGPCCLTTCLEWWCIEILVLLTGRLPDARQAVGVLAIVLNFDFLLYSVMLSLSTCASIRVSNELGANQPDPARRSASVSLALSFVAGCAGGLTTAAARGIWGPLFSHERGVIRGVKKTMVVMAVVEVVNFPVIVCGGIVRGTAAPWLAMYGNVGGFYLVALPLGVSLAFRTGLGMSGLLVGYLAGMVACLVLLLVFVARINWVEQAAKAQAMAGNLQDSSIKEEEDDKD